MILRTFFFLMIFMWVLPANAKSSQQICQEKAANIEQVKIRYKYGKLGLKQVSTAEVSANCGDNAAGCFHAVGGRYSIQTSVEKIKVGHLDCIVPIVNVDLDFSGNYIEITNEYSPCKTRAVLRHELQHFMIWKTGREQQILQTYKKLKEFAQQKAMLCNSEGKCNKQLSLDEFSNLVMKIQTKWDKVTEANNNKLDEIDHDFKKEVNYRVCEPYSDIVKDPLRH